MTIITHIPHASRFIPPDLRPQFQLSDAELAAELLAMTDAHTDQLFHGLVPGVRTVAFPVSRLVVDPERFRDDADEPMSRVGMGAVYTRTAAGRALRRALTTAERAALLARYYDPHHAALTGRVAAALDGEGGCLIVDCHSFPSVPLPYEADQDPRRPDICLGTDPVHTPPALVARLGAAFRAAGLAVAINRPFSGTLVPAAYYGRDARVQSVMIEVNRRLYMDERTGERLAGFGAVREVLRGCCGGECGGPEGPS